MGENFSFLVGAPMKSLFICFVVFVQVSFVLGQCTGTVNGITWDLSPLTYDPTTSTPPTNYQIQSSSNGNTYYINFCAAVANAISPNCNKDGPNGACQLSGGGYYGAGLISATNWQDFVPMGVYTQGVGLHYSNGVSCPSQPTSRNTIIYVACEPTAAGVGSVVSETEDGCIYTIYFASSYGCKSSPSLSPSPPPSPSPSPSASASPSASPLPTMSATSDTGSASSSTWIWIVLAAVLIPILCCIVVGAIATGVIIVVAMRRHKYQSISQ